MINIIYTYTVFSVFPSDFQAKTHTRIKRKCTQSIKIPQNSLFVCVCVCVCVCVYF
jgi:hypothetical protein